MLSMISSCYENSKNTWHFNIEFSWQYNFSGKTIFLIISYFSAHTQRNGLFQIKINAIQNHWTSINVITQKRLSFIPPVWCCFWQVLVFSSLLWLITGCSTFYKECKLYNKRDKFFELQSGASGKKANISFNINWNRFNSLFRDANLHELNFC